MKKAEKRKVVLIGTGMVGMIYAYAILNQKLCDELVLIDINKKKAEGVAMDLNHGVAFSGGNMEIYAGEYSDCRDADLIVLTAGLPQKERQSRLDLLKENRKIFESILHSVLKSVPPPCCSFLKMILLILIYSLFLPVIIGPI